MKRLLKYIFIPIFAVLFMSHNVNAIDLSLPVEYQGYFRQPYYSIFEAGSSTQSSYTNSQLIRYTNSPNVNRISFKSTSNTDFSVSKGDIITINFYVQQNTLVYSTESFYPYSFISTIGSAPTCDILKIEFDEQPYLEQTTVKYRWNGVISCRVNSDTTNPSINLLVRSNLLNLQTPAESIRVGFSNLSVYKNTPNINQEQKEAADQAISDSESSSEENSSNAKTTNLIGALSGIFTTISSTSATNCNITGDLGAINMGALNLCQGKEHFNSLVEFIGFSTLFVVVFWASYHLVRKTLGLIDWARSN